MMKIYKSIAFCKNNIVSAEVIVKGDIRAVSREQLLHARKVMQDIIQNNYPKTSATLTLAMTVIRP